MGRAAHGFHPDAAASVARPDSDTSSVCWQFVRCLLARPFRVHRCSCSVAPSRASTRRGSRFKGGGAMKLRRRQCLRLAAGAALLLAAPHIAIAQSYPTKPVHLIVGFPAGGPADIGARLTAEWLSQRLGQQVVVENRPGAATNIATEAVIRAPADGYTLLFSMVSNAINATLYGSLNFNFIRDTTPVASFMWTPGVLEVNPEVPAKTVPEFIAYAKANPGKINMASAGPGTVPHIYGELFKMMTGTDMVLVHYRGAGPAMPDMISGRIQVMFDSVPSAIQQVRGGKLRPLGVTTA